MAVETINRRVVQQDKAEELVNLIQSVVSLKYGGEVTITRDNDSIAVQTVTDFIVECNATSLLHEPITMAGTVGIQCKDGKVHLTLVYYPI